MGVRDAPSEFALKVKSYGSLIAKDLPVSEKQQLTAISKKPSFLLAWIAEWMKEAEKTGETFIKDFPYEVKPEEFSINFDEEKKQVFLKFVF